MRAALLDIEGTTTDLAFVHQRLFPYAARELPAFVRAHADHPAVASALADARGCMNTPGADLEAVIAALLDWIAADQKITPLKALQGLVWRAGYERGDFTGHVYADAAAALARWHAQGLALYVYSSGSVAAQKLLFGHSDHGDLTPLFSGYFDTRTGAKQEAASYQRITAQIGLEAATILFLSDLVAELDAARSAGLATCLVARAGLPPTSNGHRVARDFEEVQLR